MPLQSGTRLGTYEVLSLLGTGGMGEVYRARDLELHREVAIKVLPESVGADPGRLERLRREAHVLAALNHPNIGQIYGLAGDGAVRGLVLELVDGETLADRLARAGRKRLALGQALGIARQIADALEAAHAKGIVHRDLKPANVKITPAGGVKVLDFGIATVVAPEPTDERVGAGALTQVASDVGAVAGTIAYMSPEQARGAALDRRADVWAFGCVLYELLTGRAAFDGPTSTDTLAAVLSRPPDWTLLPADTPAGIRRLLERCLQKDPAQRFRDLGDARFLIEDASFADAPAEPRRSWSRLAFAAVGVAVLALLGAGALAIHWWPKPPAPAALLRMSIASPGAVTPQLSAAISPDGRNVAFVSTDESGRALLWVRALDSLEARAIPGTDHAAHPFWSPDGRSLGFVADAKVKRVDVAGGPVQVLAEIGTRNGPAWGPDGTILFTPRRDTLAAVPATGGPVKEVLAPDPAQPARAWPRFLPDGRHFIYFGSSIAAEKRGIYVGSLDSTETKFLLRSDFRAWYAAPGYLVFPRDETLLAQPFDPLKLELHGSPLPIADGVWFSRGAAQASFSVSENGALAYVNASVFKDAQLSWFDRTGRPLGAAAPAIRNEGVTPQISPDGRRIAVGRGEQYLEDIWVLPSAGAAAPVRLTFTPEGDGLPVWAADSRRIMYGTFTPAGVRVSTKEVDSGTEQLVLESSRVLQLADWSRDGRFAIFGDSRIWVSRLDAEDRTPVIYEDVRFIEAQAQLAPNGRWIAYTASETGRDEVYVQAFPTPGRKRQASSGGGAMPRWRADGGELYYVASDQYLMSVPIADTDALELGAPQRLFRTRLIVQGSEAGGLPTTYDVMSDGSRFLLRYPPEDPGPPITVVFNWTAALAH